MSVRYVVIAALLVLAGVSGGCRSATLSPSQPVTERAVIAEPSAQVKGELPAETPEGLPLWPDASIDSVSTTGGSFDLLLITDDDYDDIVTGVGAGFERAGWSVARSVEDTSATVLEVSNGEYEGLVTVYATGEGNSVEYLLTSSQL